MRIQQFTSEGRTAINWASGTSTEIFIFPANGSFTSRNFLFRISTATVEAEESTFTFFEGIIRHLMVLKGELKLVHEGRYTKQLQPFEQDTFSGEWSTLSKGKVTDFNLMLKAGASGSLTHQKIEKGNAKTFAAKSAFYFLYFASGTAALSNGNTANSGDLIRIENGSEIKIQAPEHCDLVEIQVSLLQE